MRLGSEISDGFIGGVMMNRKGGWRWDGSFQ